MNRTMKAPKAPKLSPEVEAINYLSTTPTTREMVELLEQTADSVVNKSRRTASLRWKGRECW
jgi:hypothetical protein